MMSDLMAKPRLLVIAAHPDDEVLGCGGLMKKVKDLHGEVYVLYMVVDAAPRQYDECNTRTEIAQRLSDIESVARHLGIDDYEVALVGQGYQAKLNTMSQGQLVDIIEVDSKVSLNKVKPSIVAIPPPNHFHQDHQAVFEAALAACRPIPRELKPFQDTVLFYEQPCYGWSVGRLPVNFYVDITEQLETKLELLGLHRSQLRRGLHIRTPDNVRRLAELRGREVAVAAAEAFICHRIVV